MTERDEKLERLRDIKRRNQRATARFLRRRGFQSVTEMKTNDPDAHLPYDVEDIAWLVGEVEFWLGQSKK